MEDIDYSLISKKVMAQAFPDGGSETALFLGKCKKYNRYGM